MRTALASAALRAIRYVYIGMQFPTVPISLSKDRRRYHEQTEYVRAGVKLTHPPGGIFTKREPRFYIPLFKNLNTTTDEFIFSCPVDRPRRELARQSETFYLRESRAAI